jgi:hypothetical protein
MNISNLERCITAAKSGGYKYIGVATKTPNAPENEVIIYPKANFDAKLEYYKKAYNEDLTLKSNADVQIVGFTHGNLFSEIERDLVGAFK